VRPDALTLTLSHGEREYILKTATKLPFCFNLMRPDALTLTLSHREREYTLKTATEVAVLLFITRYTHSRRGC
jgi:hypothetical protein